jgi:hypothetical protein
MFGAECVLVAGQRGLRQLERLGGAPAGDQRERQLAALAVRLRVVRAKAPQRARQQILAREDCLRLLVLLAQRGLQRLPADEAQLDQVFADPAAASLLARQGNSYFIRRRETLRDQELTKEHVFARVNRLHLYLEPCTPAKTLQFQSNKVKAENAAIIPINGVTAAQARSASAGRAASRFRRAIHAAATERPSR